MKKITIIDGNSLFFRAYYATAYPGVEIMRTKEGIPTNAIFAFSNMINKILNDIKEGEAFFIAFDTGKHTFRHEALETYKANRKPAPQELIEQFPIVREFLKAINIYQFEEEGFEGDDIAGSIARLAEKEGYEVTIYTSDRDFLQLVNDKTTVKILKKGLSDILVMTPEKVKETYGFSPMQIIDYKGLRGDSSDNLPGIPGIGEKTAVKLIEEYGSFDNILANVENIKGKIKDNIIAHQELGRISRDLAIIKTDIKLPFKVEDTIYEGYDFQTLNEFCQRYELKQFINKVSSKWKKVDETLSTIEVKKIKNIPSDIEIKDIGISIDLDGEDYSRNDVFGIGLYINSHHYYMEIDDAKNDQTIKNLLKDSTIKKYGYDFKSIIVALNRYDIQIEGIYFDLLIASYLIDSSMNTNVENVMHIFGVDLGNDENTLSLFSNNNPTKTCKVAFFSYKLFNKVKKELDKMEAYDLYKDLEIPLITTLAEMEIEGFPIDINILNELGDIYKQKEKYYVDKIYEVVGHSFNIASPKQLGEVLYEELKLPNTKRNSTSIEALKEIRGLHPIVDLIIEYRKYSKLNSTYIEGMKPHIFNDNKIHAKFNQALTQTGRLSSSEPNLQNISIRDEEGKMIRKAFHYPNNSYEILSLDYSQIELRVLASLSKCPGLIEIFNKHEDIHEATAKKVFKVDVVDDNLRRKAKAVNFGIIYGISDWGLSEQIGCSLKEAKAIINDFYEAFPEIHQFFREIVDNATANGYVSTLLGRRRYLREIHDSNYQRREFAKRAAMNAPIQGTAADLIKLAMIKVNNFLKINNYKTRMVLQIHDELIFKVSLDEKDFILQMLKEIMENAMNLDVKFEVDGGYGKDWYNAK